LQGESHVLHLFEQLEKNAEKEAAPPSFLDKFFDGK